VLREGGPIFGGKTSNALLQGSWKLLQDRPGMPWELYNLQADPRETTDLGEKQVFLTLDAAMRRHIQQGGQVPWEPEDPAAAFPPPTSATSAHLKKWLEKFPAADLNHDGILTTPEVWEFQSPKYQAAQIQKARQSQKARLAKQAQPGGKAEQAPKAVPSVAPLKPKPDYENVKYGPHERNVLDLYLARSARPTPLVVHIHGGGWMAGDKSQVQPVVVNECLKSGISVASINYRYTTTAPLPAPHLDSARAIQFLRSKAQEWNLDPARVAAYGGSAGAGITLWLAFKTDMADPGSSDPMARQSTRLCCGATFGGQSTYDPHVIRRWIGEPAARHPVFNTAYNVKSYQELDNPKLQKIYDEVSAIRHLTADAPPIFEVYSESNVPLTPDAQVGQGMHHLIFGLKLKDAMDRLGIECVYLHTVEFSGDPNMEMVNFFRKHLGMQ
jgi:acetyl esterase/lipase